jgi:hypothetical protein
MSRMIYVIVMVLAIAFLAHGKPFVQLGGNDGSSLLKDLTNNSTNNSLDFPKGNKTASNLSQSTITIPLGGNDGTSLLKSLTNNSSGLLGDNYTSGNLSTWGSTPRVPPPPPTYDPRMAKMIEVLRQNHGM